MLLVSHEPKTIAGFCDRALLLERGRVMAAGPAAEVADQYVELLTQAPVIEPASPAEVAS
jgi:ABC-type polysaccharide/polyol phosphate transport system ATPase subunit